MSMDLTVLVKKRSPVRTAFTKVSKGLSSLMKDEALNYEKIESQYTSLERIYLDLKELDDKILDIYLMNENEDENNTYDEEYARVEEYKQTFDDIKIKFKMMKEKNVYTPRAEKTQLKLPEIELVKFGGDIKQWLTFWSQFKRIHENANLELEDKFQYLTYCMIPGSRAKSIVDSYPPTAKNYSKAIESLKSRFGREDLLTEHYVRELLSLVIRNCSSSEPKLNITELFDKLESHLRALESIGVASEKYAALLFPLVESAIPENILRIWLRSPRTSSDEDTYENKLSLLLSFLKKEVESEDRIALAKTGIESQPLCKITDCDEDEESIIPTANELFTNNTFSKRIICAFCSKRHFSKDCFQAPKMTYENKMDILKVAKVCFSCLKYGHRSKDCRAEIRCTNCSKGHYAILCPGYKQVSERKIHSRNNEESNTLSNFFQTKEVLLQTLLVAIESNGKKHIVRALIDSGSQCSYILKSAANKLGLKPLKTQSLNHVVFGGASSFMEHNVFKFKIHSINNNYCCDIRAFDQPKICGPLPRIAKGPWIEKLKSEGIQITDVGLNPSPIELLIGADFAGKIYTGKIVRLCPGLVTLETRLGWVLMGKQEAEADDISLGSAATSLLIHYNNIEDLWKLEAIGIKDRYEELNKEEHEKIIKQNLIDTMEVDRDGRYEIKLPWIEKERLLDNEDLAEKRLERTTSKLLLEKRYDLYDAVFQEWLDEKIIEIVPPDEVGNFSCYLPHRGVFKNDSTTKVRPVFDASNKKRGYPSLNDCLEKGPNTLELIPEILTRFRENKIGIIADIKKAFLQISICKDDRDFLRFLWWKDRDRKELQIFRHRRVVFGVICSPFILGAVIEYHLKRAEQEFEDVSKLLQKSFYVDNCVASVNSEQELEQFIKTSVQIMSGAKMELRGWESNYKTSLCDQSSLETPVLGLLWNKENDQLCCNLKNLEKPKEPLTRRMLLSVAQKIFDPVGFTCPVTLIPKLLLQESWKSKLSWDDNLPEDVAKKFWNWFNELILLKDVKIPRYLFVTDFSSFSLHVFCDASGLSFAAVIFLRSTTDKDIGVQLVMAKSRIAPLKKLSIPRLELMACTIGVRLLTSVKRALNLQKIKEYFWTDSASVLYWIQHEDYWGVFVQNRVKEIRKFSNAMDWRHISGTKNPADLPSRGCSVKKLLDSRWWEGPDWLKKEEREWPKSDINVLTDLEEVFKEKKQNTASLTIGVNDSNWFLSYFSSYKKIVRMVGWILRFSYNCRNKKEDRLQCELSIDEYLEAERRIIRIVQEVFTEEYLKNLKSISCFKDNDGLFRVNTKITERKDYENFKQPILLPNKHKLVELLIQDRHLSLLHSGLNCLMMNLREQFWILNGKKAIRKVISKCIRCKRHSARPFETISVPLPENRVRDAMVFEVVGVDLTGPLMLKEETKCWIVVYTCAVYRAVHFELVKSLNTVSFLLSLRRFIARRGRPHVIYSDNGTNFVGANNLFLSINWQEVKKEADLKQIKWIFNPPTAAWWGGFWERLIRILKGLLRRTLGNARLSYEELVTILYDCEAIINSRPITYISENSEDLSPLTPAMFLQDNRTVGVPDLDHMDNINLAKRIRYQQTLREELRKRFRSEYLGQLLLNKSKLNCFEAKVGDIVLIEKEDAKRAFWPMGRITQIFPGKDNVVRLVKVKTKSGWFLRPVQRVYPLEISQPNELSVVDDELPTCNVRNIADEEVSKNLSDKNSIRKRIRKVKIPQKFKDFELF